MSTGPLKPILLVALGGNALIGKGERGAIAEQFANLRGPVRQIARLSRTHRIIVTHGNGPQVGLLALEAAAITGVEPYTLDILNAQSEGMIGYMIEQELGNILPEEVPFATILTQVEIDPADPAFDKPTKPIGPQYPREEAERLATGAHPRLAVVGRRRVPQHASTAAATSQADGGGAHLERIPV